MLGIDEDNSLVAYVLALPSQLIRGLFNRVALFVWWTGSWANEGKIYKFIIIIIIKMNYNDTMLVWGCCALSRTSLNK